MEIQVPQDLQKLFDALVEIKALMKKGLQNFDIEYMDRAYEKLDTVFKVKEQV